MRVVPYIFLAGVLVGCAPSLAARSPVPGDHHSVIDGVRLHGGPEYNSHSFAALAGR